MSNRILFVSRRNSLRSMLAQACLSHMGGHSFVAESCGQPGSVAQILHPAAGLALNVARIPLPSAPPRPWTDLWRAGTPRLDFVVTLDEKVLASEPAWPGQPISALWAFQDAAALENQDDATRAAMQILYSLQRRLELLINLPLAHADTSATQYAGMRPGRSTVHQGRRLPIRQRTPKLPGKARGIAGPCGPEDSDADL
ncbi:MAG TPA: protein tyrosine phosphatase [Variovorax sp.]|nr:protein tyrosine phosphatase [Variovorax sp.]